MRKIFCLSLSFLLLFSAFAYAADSGAKADGIAVFDLQRVVNQSDALKDASAALEKKFGPKKAELEKERTAIEKKAEGFKSKAPNEKQQADFNKQHRTYSEKGQTLMRDVQAEETKVRSELGAVIAKAAKELGAQKGYALLLDAAAAPYFDPKLDVTDEMFAQVNEVWKKQNSK